MAITYLCESAPSRIHPDRHVSITATVELHHGTKPPRYLADCHVEFGDRTFARGYAVLRTRGEAEDYVRRFWAALLPLWRASLTGPTPDHPFARQAAAMAAHVAATVPDGLGYYERIRAEQTAGDTYRAAHPWTEYV